MAELLGKDYHLLVYEFRELFAATYGEGEDRDSVTPALVVQWAQRHEHSCCTAMWRAGTSGRAHRAVRWR